MKKALFPMLGLVLALSLALPVATPALANDGPEVDKSLSASDGYLGDIITVTLDVDNSPGIGTVEDVLPDGLKYIPGTFTVNSVGVTPTVVGNTVSTTIGSGDYDIELDVQVVEVQATAETVTNTANLRDDVGGILDSDSEDITLHPYEIEKEVELIYEEIEDGQVSVNELVQWDMTITINNTFAWAITNATLSDNLGAELGLAGDGIDNDLDTTPDDGTPGDLAAGYNTVPGTLTTRLTGKTNKVHLSITGIDIAAGETVQCVLGIFTDYNPGKGKTPGIHCYSSPTPPGGEPYELNSGAVIKFTDPNTDFQLSAHTGSLTVTVVELV